MELTIDILERMTLDELLETCDTEPAHVATDIHFARIAADGKICFCHAQESFLHRGVIHSLDCTKARKATLRMKSRPPFADEQQPAPTLRGTMEAE